MFLCSLIFPLPRSPVCLLRRLQQTSSCVLLNDMAIHKISLFCFLSVKTTNESDDLSFVAETLQNKIYMAVPKKLLPEYMRSTWQSLYSNACVYLHAPDKELRITYSRCAVSLTKAMVCPAFKRSTIPNAVPCSLNL